MSTLRLEPSASVEVRTYELVRALAPTPSDQCISNIHGGQKFGGRSMYPAVQYVVGAWWAHAVGSPIDLSSVGDPTVTSAIQALLSRAEADQARIINSTVKNIQDCTPLTNLTTPQ